MLLSSIKKFHLPFSVFKKKNIANLLLGAHGRIKYSRARNKKKVSVIFAEHSQLQQPSEILSKAHLDKACRCLLWTAGIF